jgi:hypothetical protein
MIRYVQLALLTLLFTGCVSGSTLTDKGYTHIIVLYDSYYSYGGQEYRSRPILLRSIPKRDGKCVHVRRELYCGNYSISPIDSNGTYGFKSYEY